tara:strand:+ start:2179 stop:2361 length:183 start_codon:yes stop_codon:yes gene_type:complete
MKILVAFPNHNYTEIDEEIVLNWELELRERYEDRTFCVSEGELISIKTEHYDYLVQKKKK